MNILIFVVIGITAGWLSGRIINGRGLGLLGNLTMGSIGGALGVILFETLDVIPPGNLGTFIIAVIGSTALLFVLGGFKRTKD